MSSFYNILENNGTESLAAPLAQMGIHPTAAVPFRVVRVCLMVCGHFKGKLLEENGDYAKMYTAWLEAALPKNSNIKLVLDAYEAQEQKYPKRDQLDGYDAVLVSGSKFDAFGEEPWITRLMMFLQEVSIRHTKIRIYGICFGHQIVCRALGGVVERNGGRWETGLTRVQTTYMGKLLFGVEEMNLVLFHQDRVVLDSLSDFFTTGELYLLGNSNRTDNQGIVKFYPYHEKTPCDELVHRVQIMTTQAHPEFTEKIITEMLRSRYEKGTITEEAHEEYFGTKGNLSETEPIIKRDTGKRWQKHYDGVRVIGRTFWRMMGVHYGNEHPPKVPA